MVNFRLKDGNVPSGLEADYPPIKPSAPTRLGERIVILCMHKLECCLSFLDQPKGVKNEPPRLY